MEYRELKNLYDSNFSLNFFGKDFSNKIAIISLVCHLTETLKAKKPDVTYWTVLYKLNKKCTNPVPEELLKRISIICEDFSYGCSIFPNFGVKEKDIPDKIVEILNTWIPF